MMEGQAKRLEAMARESGLQTMILQWVEHNWMVVRLWPLPGGREHGMPGASDMFGIAHGGRFVSVAIKRYGENLTPEQVIYRASVMDMGAIHIVVSKFSDFEDGLRKAGVL